VNQNVTGMHIALVPVKSFRAYAGPPGAMLQDGAAFAWRMAQVNNSML